MSQSFGWADGSRIAIDAQAAGEELERVRKAGGGNLTAVDVVEAARPRRSPIHDAFEWDDRKAAGEYRKERARHMLRSLTVVIEEGPSPQPWHAYVVLEEQGKKHYKSLQVALGYDSLRSQLLEKAKKEMNVWRRRYQYLHELAKVFEAIDAANGKPL